MGFPWVGRCFPPKSHVQGEPRAHLEIILRVECKHRLPDALVALFPEGHAAEKLRLGKDEILDVLERVLTSAFRLNSVVILNAPDDSAPFEAVPALDVGQIVPKLPEVIDPEPREGGVRSYFANRGRSALLADRQCSHDLARDESERLRQFACSDRILELSRTVERDANGIK